MPVPRLIPAWIIVLIGSILSVAWFVGLVIIVPKMMSRPSDGVLVPLFAIICAPLPVSLILIGLLPSLGPGRFLPRTAAVFVLTLATLFMFVFAAKNLTNIPESLFDGMGVTRAFLVFQIANVVTGFLLRVRLGVTISRFEGIDSRLSLRDMLAISAAVAIALALFKATSPTPEDIKTVSIAALAGTLAASCTALLIAGLLAAGALRISLVAISIALSPVAAAPCCFWIAHLFEIPTWYLAGLSYSPGSFLMGATVVGLFASTISVSYGLVLRRSGYRWVRKRDGGSGRLQSSPVDPSKDVRSESRLERPTS
ncbi:MAG: hypothetical protein AAF802_02055 [Planctomycetota bacterium]